jgi:prepilin-type N-terminal cleavage/methylation domain-containing protein
VTSKPSQGFTLVELVIVLLIGSLLVSIAVGKIGTTRSHLAGNAARQAFLALHARTRAQAIEFGATARLMIDTGGDSAWIVQRGQTIETYRFALDEVDVESDAHDAIVTMCMIPRGYSEPRCNSFGESVELRFVTTESEASVVLLPMGQTQW